MAKFRGKVGYVKSFETSPGVFVDRPIERYYRGDVVNNNVRWQPTQELNDNLTINNSISIIADSFAYENIGYMRYIWWMGTAFKITGIKVQRPRLTLTIGGVYNGPKIETA